MHALKPTATQLAKNRRLLTAAFVWEKEVFLFSENDIDCESATVSELESTIRSCNCSIFIEGVSKRFVRRLELQLMYSLSQMPVEVTVMIMSGYLCPK